MEIETDQNWLKYEDFALSNPLICEVQEVRLVQVTTKTGKPKQDVILVFALPDKNTRMSSIWGDNKNQLIKAWGNDIDLWKGKFLVIKQEEIPGQKAKRSFTAR